MIRKLKDLDLGGKRVFVRADFNVPIERGRITEMHRIESTLPTLRFVLEKAEKLLLASHLGRPGGKRDPEWSLAPVREALEKLLSSPVALAPDSVGPEVEAMARDPRRRIVLLENLRFHKEEEKNDPGFSQKLAALAEVYVNDAFGAAHRAHASVAGAAGLFSEKGAGLLLEKEVRELSRLLDPERPFAAILGGAKISGKIDTLRALSRRADLLLIGGGMANHFVSALGLSVGRSLLEEDSVPLAREILDFCKREGKTIALPSDFVVASSPGDAAGARTVGITKIPEDAMALDVGQKTLEQFERLLEPVRTIFWNGPMGVFEKPPFDRGTKALAMLLAESSAVTVVGGGESVAAAREAGVADRFTHVSTGGGASLEFLTGGTLPGIEALG